MTHFTLKKLASRYSNPLELLPVILFSASTVMLLIATGIWTYQYYDKKQRPLAISLSPVVQHKNNRCLTMVSKEGLDKSYRYCHAYAETGDSDAQLITGVQTYFGLGTKPDKVKAMAWFLRAAEQHHPQAQYLLSVGYEYGVGLSKDTNKALEWATEAAKYPYVTYVYHLGHLQRQKYPKKAYENLLKTANTQHGPSQYELALMHLKGDIKQDVNQAFYWFKQAAENKYIPAYLELAKLYQQGHGTVVDIEQALQFFSKAAGENIPEAQYRLGLLLLKEQVFEHEPQQALNWLIRAAKNNFTPAKAKIGEIYFEGVYVERDLEQALAWWVSAAQGKDYEASFHLGSILEAGQIVPKDLSAAIHWYLKSAEGNHAKAQLKLAEFYAQGVGVDKDFFKSFILYSQAANQGELGASLPLAYLYDQGLGTYQDKQKALFWYQKAAQQENPEAWRALGQAYLSSGNANQVPLAKIWLEKADKNQPATIALEPLQEETQHNTQPAEVAETSDLQALFALGKTLLSTNAPEGLSYIEKAAEEGLETAAIYLGKIYSTGEEPNVPTRYGKALNWLDKPARRGNSDAQFYLGKMFYLGLGVSKNPVTAYAWLNSSAANGNDYAGLIRNQLAMDLSPSDLEKAQKLSLEYLAKG